MDASEESGIDAPVNAHGATAFRQIDDLTGRADHSVACIDEQANATTESYSLLSPSGTLVHRIATPFRPSFGRSSAEVLPAPPVAPYFDASLSVREVISVSVAG